MDVRWIEPDASLGARRGEVVVCIPVYGGHEYFVGCLESVLEHTPDGVKILVCDDASPDRRSREFVAALGATECELLYVRREQNVGFPANVNGAFAAAAPADVVVLNSDCVVADGWLEGLREAAYGDSRIATATALTNHGSIVSVPDRAPMPELPGEWRLDDAAAAIRAGSLRLRPRLPTAIGHCMYIRRSALELVGEFDLAFSPGYGEEVDLSQRCLQAGLSHVLADDVFVLHHGGGSFSRNGAPSPVQEQHERLLATRYPYYHDLVRAVERNRTGPLARALGAARRSLTGISVVIDGGPTTATQQLIEALDAARTAANVRLVSGAETVRPADVVHRLTPVQSEADLTRLAQLGERVIVTNPDLPASFTDFDAWSDQRRLTRAALALSDHVVFSSTHARDEAIADGSVQAERASVIHPGVDRPLAGAQAEPVPPRGASRLPEDAEAILCLASEHRFAVLLVDELRRQHGWSGYLLLAGPAEPTEYTLSFEPLTDAERAWLYGRSRLVLHPEGSGVVPFEAADHGVPCMWAPATSLGEVLSDSAATIIPWSAEQSAPRALELLRDDAARERTLAPVRAAAVGLTWDAAAAQLLEIYKSVCAAPPRTAGALEPRRGLSEDAMRLLGPGGALPPELERPLLALATHPTISAPMFGALKLGYRASYRLRRRKSR